jgi:hypothetical protein
MSSTLPTLANFLRLFATNANYPGGADLWSGQPTKVEPPGTSGGFVPNQGGAAQYFNSMFHGLAQPLGGVVDWMAELGIVDIQEFTESDTYTTRDRAFAALVVGCGGGGGGAGGRNGSTSIDNYVAGGGGGSGAQFGVRLVTLLPNVEYEIGIGSGGTAVSAQTNGNAGGTTYLSDGSNFLARFVGGGGGFTPPAAGPSTAAHFALGGHPAHSANGIALKPGSLGAGQITYTIASAPTFLEMRFPLGSGGYSSSGTAPSPLNISSPGALSAQGFGGGDAGARGADVSSYRGGGGGGGGGGGPFGAGAAGGVGGQGNGGSFSAGGNGSNGGANSGAGGGGGGSAGADTISRAGGSGGAGGSGRLYLVVFERALAP